MLRHSLLDILLGAIVMGGYAVCIDAVYGEGGHLPLVYVLLPFQFFTLLYTGLHAMVRWVLSAESAGFISALMMIKFVLSGVFAYIYFRQIPESETMEGLLHFGLAYLLVSIVLMSRLVRYMSRK